MRLLFSKRFTVLIVVLIVFIFGFLWFIILGNVKPEPETVAPIIPEPNIKYEVIGKSVKERPIEVYSYGEGETHLVFIGGIHGGYEWNSVLLAYAFIDYLEDNQNIIPENIMISVIPSANPDGVHKILGIEGRFTILDIPKGDASSGRFNANGVDLNRNFDCKWKSEGIWREKVVSAGDEPFSEPEARAIRDFVLKNNPDAVIFWHSQANAVYASECEDGILPQTIDIMNVYAKSSGYRSVESFDSYEVNGDAEGWLASIGIPSITVELKTHEDIEWDRNLAGIKSLIEYFK